MNKEKPLINNNRTG